MKLIQHKIFPYIASFSRKKGQEQRTQRSLNTYSVLDVLEPIPFK